MIPFQLPFNNKHPFLRICNRWETYVNNLNSSLIWQVIHQKGKGLWILFNRWGRVCAYNGQHQQTPFQTVEEATTEFKKIFRSKTSNEWSRCETYEHFIIAFINKITIHTFLGFETWTHYRFINFVAIFWNSNKRSDINSSFFMNTKINFSAYLLLLRSICSKSIYNSIKSFKCVFL